MQQDKDKDDDRRKGGEDSWKKKSIDATADALDVDEATEDKITVPTKTEDGGSSNQEQADRNISENENEEVKDKGKEPPPPRLGPTRSQSIQTTTHEC